MKIRNQGFTLVELIVVIVVISILATIAIAALNVHLTNTRDTQRVADVGVISERLEKYFERNGEYPVCSSLQGNAGDIYQGDIKIEASALIAPTSETPDTSSVKCTALTASDDSYAYIGASCVSGVACASWEIQYLEEASNTVVKLQSRHIASAVTPPPPDPPTPPSGGGLIYTVEEVTAICEKEAPAPAGYNVINAPGGGTTVNGTSGMDLVFGGPGINIVYGAGGDDILCGNSGMDRLYGQDGHDYIVGGSGIDELYGGNGNDLISGDSGADSIYGNDGDDLLYGGTGSDTIDGGNGTDSGNDPSGGTYISIEVPF